MSKITTILTITNRTDQSAPTRGYIPPDQVRSITLKNVLVDPRATSMSLPPEAIALIRLLNFLTIFLSLKTD